MPDTTPGLAGSVLPHLAAVPASVARLSRAAAYAERLGAHVAEIRARLDAAAGGDSAGPLRSELIEVERQHRQALTILGDVEAEHGRHEADLRALLGSDGEVRAALGKAHVARDKAKVAADEASTIFARAKTHADAVKSRLDAALDTEVRHNANATARLHAALRDGTEAPAASEPFVRSSPALEDDLRAARAAVDRLAAGLRALNDRRQAMQGGGPPHLPAWCPPRPAMFAMPMANVSAR